MKIRMDFVTNSSSSSFVCFGVFSEELKEYVEQLINEGKAREKADFKEYRLLGEEACSYLFYKGDGVYTYQQLYSDFKPITDRALDIFDANLYEDFWYTPEMEQSDKKKILKYPQNASNSIESFFRNLSTEQSRKLQTLVSAAAKAKNVGCSVFEGVTDDAPNFDSPVREIKSDWQEMKEQEAKKAKESSGKVLPGGTALEGKVCCLTGDFKYGSKDSVKEYIEALGGTCSSTVAKKTNMLIIGALGSVNYSHGNYGKKYEAAKAKQDSGDDIEILSEKEFFAKYTGAGNNKAEGKKSKTPGSQKEQEETIAGTLDIKENTYGGKTLQKYNQGNKMEHVTIPYDVIKIEESAFAHCSNLSSVEFGSGVCKIGRQAFSDCKNLKSISVPEKVTVLSAGMFDGCKGLVEIKLPETLKEISDEAFVNCTSLTSVRIPARVGVIGIRAFRGCSKLESVTVPDSVIKIEDEAFYGCRRLREVHIPDGISKIYSKTFYNCKCLTDITIPNSVETISHEAFKGCSNLANVTIPDSVNRIDKDVFNGCSSLTIHAPAGSCAERYAKENNISYVAE